MPRPDSSRVMGAFSSAGRGHGYSGLSSEEVAGIAILAIIAAVVFIAGCWYFKRRNGYKILGSHAFSPAAIRSLMRGPRDNAECKVPLKDYSTLTNVVPCAPPAYEKIATVSQPPPYTP
ncbi:melanoma antigen recognized by T-cells 1 [Pelobates cultripes]|uniref:Melanoma antigen recognized by T-cells 1 n=1 Tax=Pelobates cultripes TaxID=61616 RepID=A0AAD1S9C6_PELCU|nr:melanoma antigen recognized by T-cells 1 [Pelobates cultripes]